MPIGEAMKILMLTPYFAPHVGGVEKHVEKVSKEFVRRGNQVTVITWKHSPDLPEMDFLDGIHLYRIPETGRKKIWSWMWRNRGLFKVATVIHCHDFVTFYHWFLPLRFLYFWKPIFVTFHGYEKFPPNRKTILIRRMVEKISSGSICVGKYISKWYGTDCEKLLWGGVDNVPPKTAQKREDSAVFVGRLEEDTGIAEYLHALKILEYGYGIAPKLYVCGDGSLRHKISEISQRYGLDVVLCGIVDQPLEYLQKCRYAFVSGYLTILEAMISKTLVFSVFDNPLKEDYLKMMPNHEKMMVVCSSPGDLANKFSRIRENPELQEEIVSNAYRFAEKRSWDKVAREYMDLYARKVNVE